MFSVGVVVGKGNSVAVFRVVDLVDEAVVLVSNVVVDSVGNEIAFEVEVVAIGTSRYITPKVT